MPIDQVLLLGLIPAAALLAGSVSSFVGAPSSERQSAVQHFTAGVILAALAAEVLPEIAVTTQPIATLLGFAAGVGIMMLVRGLDVDEGVAMDGPATEPPVEALVVEAARPTGAVSMALLAAIAIDLLIDGVLSGVTLAVGEGGLLILGAVALEVVFIGASLCQGLRQSRLSPQRIALTLAGLAALIPLGAAIGAVGFAGASLTLKTAVLSLAVAVLLYLVVEELMAEAHGLVEDTRMRSVLFFAGFILIFFVSAYVT